MADEEFLERADSVVANGLSRVTSLVPGVSIDFSVERTQTSRDVTITIESQDTKGSAIDGAIAGGLISGLVGMPPGARLGKHASFLTNAVIPEGISFTVKNKLPDYSPVTGPPGGSTEVPTVEERETINSKREAYDRALEAAEERYRKEDSLAEEEGFTDPPENPDTTEDVQTGRRDPSTIDPSTTRDNNGGGGGNNGGGSGGTGDGGSYSGSGLGKDDSGPAFGDPIIFDLDGDGVELLDLTETQAFFDWQGDGFSRLTSWVSPDDGILAYDKDSDGVIRDADEISFTGYLEGAKTDLEGLKAFDSNDDDVFDSRDIEWEKFGVWQDANSDGVQDEGEFRKLTELDILQISLVSDNQRETRGNNIIHGKTTYTTNDSVRHELADVSFLSIPLGIKPVDIEQGVYDLLFGTDNVIRLVGTSDNPVAQDIDLSAEELLAVFSSNGADILNAGSSKLGVIIYGGGGGDTITGGTGNDLLNGGLGVDSLLGGDGNDILVGGFGADSMLGGDGNDIIVFDDDDYAMGEIKGGAGEDIGIYAGRYRNLNIALASYGLEGLIAGYGNDTLIGTDGDNLLLGGIGNDAIAGGGGDDLVIGGDGADSLAGGDGDDLVIGGTGADSLAGGAGNDTLYVDIADLAWNGGAGVDTAFYAGDNDLDISISDHGVEVFLSGAGDDILRTSLTKHAIIDGGAGDDIIYGGHGADWLAGGKGVNILNGGYGDDTYFYQYGDGQGRMIIHDVYTQTYTHTTVYLYTNGTVKNKDPERRTRELDAGDDKLVLGEGIELENLVITFTDNNLNIGFVYSWWYFMHYNEALIRITLSNWNNDNQRIETLEMYDGLTISLSSISTWRMGTVGGDPLIGDIHNNWLSGGYGSDHLYGEAGEDVLAGGQGDDILNGGAGADVIYGGGGIDTVSYSYSPIGVNIDLADNVAEGGDAQGDRLHGVENIVGSGKDDILRGDANDNGLYGWGGDDELYGGDGDDNLVGGGGDGDDYLYGEAGNDILTGGAGGDLLSGGMGEDTASYANATMGVLVNLANRFSNEGEAAGDELRSIEIIEGSSFADRLIGDENGNRLEGGAGNDFLQGGEGSDILHGGAGGDTASYGDAELGVRVYLANSALNSGEASGDSYESIENIYGSRFNDELVGNANVNVLEGGAGEDLLDGEGGSDSASYLNSDSGVDASLLRGYGLGGHAEGDIYVDIEDLFGSRFADRLEGNDDGNRLDGYRGSDELYGRGGDDLLYGGLGDDLLQGGAGDDTLVGGQGADIYVFRAREGHDRINEIVGDENKIIFESLGDDNYEDTSFEFTRWNDDLHISTRMGNEVTLTGYYSDLDYKIFTESSDGALAEILVVL